MLILNKKVIEAIEYDELSNRNQEVIEKFMEMRGLDDYQPFIFIDFDEKKFHKFSVSKDFHYHLTSLSHESMMIAKYLFDSGMAGRSMIISYGHSEILETGLVPEEFHEIVSGFVTSGYLPEDFSEITEEDFEGFGKSDLEVGPQPMIFDKDKETGDLTLIEASDMIRTVYEDKQDYYLVNHDQCQYVKISDVEIVQETRFNDVYGHAILPFMYYLTDPTIDLDHSWMRRQYLGAWFGDNVEIVRSNTAGFDFAIYGTGYDYEEVSMPLQGQDFLAIDLEN